MVEGFKASYDKGLAKAFSQQSAQLRKMTKKETTYSNAGKGDKSRISNHKKYSDNWEKIFGKGKKNEKTIDDIRGGRKARDEVSDR